MASWKEPETNHTAGDQVTPEIFNTLAENEVYLNETKITTNQVQEATVMSETSATRENLTEQDTVMGAFGKIRKWFADLRALAFKDTVVTADINNSAVTSDKIASSAVTSKIGDEFRHNIENQCIGGYNREIGKSCCNGGKTCRKCR